MRFLFFLVVTLGLISCGSPTCIGHTLSVGPRVHFARVTVYSEPVEEPLERLYEAGVGMFERFERSDTITIYAKGGMTVSDGIWPERCPRTTQDELAEVSRAWKPIFDGRARFPQTYFESMANPYTGDDWRADGPHLEISFGPVSGKTFQLMWDGQSSLPEELDTAVIGTLEMVCSNSRLAKKYLLRGLPRQVASRLECSSD